MELVIVLAFLVHLALCCLVGWVSDKRGRGAAFGFFLSFFFTPFIGLLVLVALGNAGNESASNSAAVLEYKKLIGSLDPRDYDDFAQAFPGTNEAYTALKQKRLVEEWQRLDSTDGKAIEEFLKSVTSPELSAQFLRIVETTPAPSVSVTEFLQRKRAAAQAILDRRKLEEKLAIEQAEKKLGLEAEQAEKLRKKIAVVGRLASVAVGALILLLMAGWWNDHNYEKRVVREAMRALDSDCPTEDASMLAAEARERDRNAGLRSKIQAISANLERPSGEISPEQKLKLTQELSELRNRLVGTNAYRKSELARERFYACQSSAAN